MWPGVLQLSSINNQVFLQCAVLVELLRDKCRLSNNESAASAWMVRVQAVDLQASLQVEDCLDWLIGRQPNYKPLCGIHPTSNAREVFPANSLCTGSNSLSNSADSLVACQGAIPGPYITPEITLRITSRITSVKTYVETHAALLENGNCVLNSLAIILNLINRNSKNSLPPATDTGERFVT